MYSLMPINYPPDDLLNNILKYYHLMNVINQNLKEDLPQNQKIVLEYLLEIVEKKIQELYKNWKVK